MKHIAPHRCLNPSPAKRCLCLLFALLCLSATCRSAVGQDDVKRGEALAKRGKTASSILVLNRVIESFQQGNASRDDSALLMRALTCGAADYNSLGNSHQSLAYYQRAIGIAKALGDKQRLAALYNNVFAIYFAQHEYDQATELLQMSLGINLATGDSAAIRNNYNNFGLMASNRGEYEQAIKQMEKALAFSPHNDPIGQSMILTNLADVHCRQDRLNLAERELSKALAMQGKQPFDYRTLQTSLNMALVKAWLGKRGEAARMLPNIYSLMPRAPLSMQANSFAQMAEIHFCLDDSLAALKDILRCQQLSDSLHHANNEAQLQQLLVAYDADRLKQRNASLQQTVANRTTFAYVTLAFLALLAALMVALLRRHRADKRKNELIRHQQDRLLAYEQQEHQRRQQELSLEIDHKNRQLTSYTIDLATINEFHKRISDNLTSLRSDKRLAGDADETVAEIVRSLQHFNDKPLGNDFHLYFDEVHPGFLSRLSERFALSKSDLRLCAYLHLGMTTKEIAALTFKEVRSVESSRNRLRKKLGLAPEANLQQFLADIASGENNTATVK